MHLVWLKRDLRIEDHGPLFRASLTEKMMAVYIFEPKRMAEPDYGANHHAFIVDSLRELQQELVSLNIPLLYFVGEVVEVLSTLKSRYKTIHLHSHMEVGGGWTYDRDKQVKRWCQQQGVEWIEYPIFEVLRPHQNRDQWATRWREGVGKARFPTPHKQSRPVEPPSFPTMIVEPPSSQQVGLGEPAPQRQQGGRSQGIALWQSFLAERGKNYRKEMSSPLTAFDACSRLSPHLAWGTLSIREVYRVATHAQSTLVSAKHHRRSLDSFISRLHWRGHFMQKLEDQVEIENHCFHPLFEGLRPQKGNRDYLEAWKEGRTGVPIVDACMRALVATGWLNFRMRAMVVSFACYNLWLDWREIRDWLACQFTDYEPGIHISQLQMQAGVTGINVIRVYNPYKQSVDLDPDGVFIKRWVPEVRSIPKEYIHQPFEVPPLIELMLNLDRGGYPQPIVDLEQTSKQAKERVFAIKQSLEAKVLSQQVFQRHGSRGKRHSKLED